MKYYKALCVLLIVSGVFTGCYYQEAKDMYDPVVVENEDAQAMTHEMFEEIQEGMTIEEVKEIVGHEPKEESTYTHEDGMVSVSMMWDGPNPQDQDLFDFAFENGVLVIKFYINPRQLQEEAEGNY